MKNKKIIAGVTGGIAAYKAAELVRLLVRAGADTRVAMTAHATKFVTPLTFETLTGNRVAWDMWDHGAVPIDHIHWGQESDLIIIAPATANFIAKMAHGIGDDFLSTLILAAAAKVLVCPSMNMHMFQNPVVRDNVELLKQRGFDLMMPLEGELACGDEGLGRLPEPADILEHARMLLSDQDLLGLRILVTAGPTVEPLDPVRYLTNRSSGKMGYALARAARLRGAEVMLVSGPTGLRPPQDISFCGVKTAEEMRQAVLGGISQYDVIIKAAAVSDYRPRDKADEKMKKGKEHQTLELVKNPDILADLGSMKGDSAPILVGFSAETEDLMVNASQKLEKKNLDMIVANDVSREDAGFESDTNLVKVMYRDGHMEEFPLMTKDEVANQLLERIKELWEHRSASR
jgi:phosphopantothenoylcysteine decarboxylase/phosphopantothenate--cysteine ligase